MAEVLFSPFVEAVFAQAYGWRSWSRLCGRLPFVDPGGGVEWTPAIASAQIPRLLFDLFDERPASLGHFGSFMYVPARIGEE